MHMPRADHVVVSNKGPTVVDLRVARRGAIHGTILDPTGDTALAGVTVRLLDAQRAPVQSLATDLHGAFRFADVRAGTYVVLVEAPRGYAAEPAERVVALAAAEEQEVELTLYPAGIVRGRVLDEDSQEPLPGLEVSLYDSNGRLVATATTAAGGEYEFKGLAEDKYTVEIDP